VSVPCRTLESVLEEQKIEPGFDLLVVDVEGAESDVFNSFDLSRWRPRMMIVELEDLHRDFAAHEEIAGEARTLRRKIMAVGYVPVYVDQINTVFRAID
jgi:Methyltransferase FkbM domain